MADSAVGLSGGVVAGAGAAKSLYAFTGDETNIAFRYDTDIIVAELIGVPHFNLFAEWYVGLEGKASYSGWTRGSFVKGTPDVASSHSLNSLNIWRSYIDDMGDPTLTVGIMGVFTSLSMGIEFNPATGRLFVSEGTGIGRGEELGIVRAADGSIIAVAVTNGGAGFVFPLTAEVVDPTGTGAGATVTVTIAGGVITAAAVTAAGIGYSAQSFIRLSPPSYGQPNIYGLHIYYG